MKIGVFFLQFFIFASVQQNASAANKDQCLVLAGIAEKIMRSRQDGVPKKELVAEVGDNRLGSSTKKLVDAVYASPIYDSPEQKSQVTNIFKGNVYSHCLKNY